MVKHILDDGGRCSDNARGNCKWAGEGLAKKICLQDGLLETGFNMSTTQATIIPILQNLSALI